MTTIATATDTLSATTENATTALVTTTTEATTTQPTTTEIVSSADSKVNEGADVGMVIGVVIGSTVFVIFILLTALYLRGRYLKKKNKPPPDPLPNPQDIDKIALEASKIKKSKKKKNKQRRDYEKDPTSTVSIEQEAPSCPAFMAPDPPSTSSVDYENAPSRRKQLNSKAEPDPPPSHKTKEPGYVNTPPKVGTTQRVELTDDYYVAPKANTAKLYSTGEGSEYYICDERKSTPNSKGWKPPPRNPLEDSVTSTCSAIDYVNMYSKSKYLELVPETTPVEEPQDFYEPVDS